MSSSKRKWSERILRAIHPSSRNELVLDLQIDPRTGRMIWSSTPVPYPIYQRYLEDHALVPRAVEELSGRALLELVDAAEREGSGPAWQRALIQLAHHGSALASKILEGLEGRVPRKLHDYWELAYAESVGWLGLEYVRGREGAAQLLPAGTIFPLIGPASETESGGGERIPN